MKLIAIPGWACDKQYFSFLENVKCFDWGFYYSDNIDPKVFLAGEMNEDFIFLAYSMGSLYLDEVLSSKFCKGAIVLSGFTSFCGKDNKDSKLVDKVSQMALALNANPAKLIESFQTLAGSAFRKNEYYNKEILLKGLDILKTKRTQVDSFTKPMLLLRGQKDRILHPKVALQLFRRFPNAEQHCLIGEKHDLSQSTKAQETIKKFLEVNNV